jgi:ketosteroid isomerase-like protein
MSYPAEEIEEAFRYLWQVGPVGEDWTAQMDLYTDDCVYFDHHYGTMTPAQFGEWCEELMKVQFPELYTVYEWHKIDGDQVMLLAQNRRDSPDPDGPAYLDFPSVSIYTYGGGGKWSAERDFWDMGQAVAIGRRYRELCERHDPEHPSRRSRLHWPASPDWARPASDQP